MDKTVKLAISAEKKANLLVITNADQEAAASEFLLKVRKVEKEIDKLNEPSRRQRQNDIAFWKPSREALSNATKIVTKMLTTFKTKEMAKEQKRIEAMRPQANETGVRAMDTTPPVSATERVETKSGSVGYTATKTVIIDDLQSIPWEYLRVEAKVQEIKADILKGVVIPGCHLEEIIGLNRRT